MDRGIEKSTQQSGSRHHVRDIIESFIQNRAISISN
jgi:hypothetical protein